MHSASTSDEILPDNIDAANKEGFDDSLKKETILSKLDLVFNQIKEKAENNPDVLKAADKFINSFDNICTE